MVIGGGPPASGTYPTIPYDGSFDSGSIRKSSARVAGGRRPLARGFSAGAELDRTFIGDLEKGTKQPSPNTVIQLALALKIMPGVMVDKAALLKFPDLNPDNPGLPVEKLDKPDSDR